MVVGSYLAESLFKVASFSGNINNSLMTLRSCIECLRENQKNQESGNRLKVSTNEIREFIATKSAIIVSFSYCYVFLHFINNLAEFIESQNSSGNSVDIMYIQLIFE